MLGIQGPFGLPSRVPTLLEVPNLCLRAVVNGTSMTVSLASPGTQIGFRSSDLTKGELDVAEFTGTLQLVIPGSATLGHTSGNPAYIHVYLLNRQGTLSLGVSTAKLDETLLQSSTAISASATSATVLYASDSLTSVPLRLVGKIYSSQAAAGTYATAPAQVTVGHLNEALSTSVLGTATTITANTTYVVPSNVRLVLVQMAGGGGGGGGGGGTAAGAAGSAGANSTFGSVTAVGGLGGAGGMFISVASLTAGTGDPGDTGLFGVGGAIATAAAANTGAGGGGANGGSDNLSYIGSGGLGGKAGSQTARALTVTPGSNISAVVGAGGAGGANGGGGGAGNGGAGGSGAMIITVIG